MHVISSNTIDIAELPPTSQRSLSLLQVTNVTRVRGSLRQLDCAHFRRGRGPNRLFFAATSAFAAIKTLHTSECPFGAYSVCATTALISIISNLFFLMAQAFVSRVLVPGVSIFVSASVRGPSNVYIFKITKSSNSPRAKQSHMRHRFWIPSVNQVLRTMPTSPRMRDASSGLPFVYAGCTMALFCALAAVDCRLRLHLTA